MPRAPKPSAALPSPPGPPPVAVVIGLLAIYLAVAFHQVLRVPFMADDFLILKRILGVPFASLWSPYGQAFNYWRPWSREFTYWASQRLFGVVEPPLHLLALGLWLSITGLYFAFARRLVGQAGASVATAGVAAMAAWSAPLYWIAGVQELWMLTLTLASLLLVAHERTAWATVVFGLALLSKEPSLVVPGVAISYLLLIERRSFALALRRTAPLWVVVAAWALVHPRLVGSLWQPAREFVPSWSHPSALAMAGRALLAAVNLDEWPRPTTGWIPTLVGAVGAVVPLAALVTWGAWGKAASANPPAAGAPRLVPLAPRVSAFALLWAVLCWLPLLEPTLPWNAYYALAPSLGLWLVLGASLARWRGLALALVSALALARAARTTTMSTSLGSEWYQTRVAEFTAATRDYFLSRYPSLAPHTRVYFSGVPGSAGFFPGESESIVLQVWYREPTLQAFYASRYRPRDPGAPEGTDRLFSYDSTAGWFEVPIVALRDTIPPQTREERAARLWDEKDYGGALGEYLRLADLFPDQFGYAYNVGSCYYAMGDSVEASRWYRRAASHPDAPETVKETARRMERPGRP